MSLLQRGKKDLCINVEPDIINYTDWIAPRCSVSPQQLRLLSWISPGELQGIRFKEREPSVLLSRRPKQQNEDSLRTLESTKNSLARPLAGPTAANELPLRWMADTYSSSGKKAGKKYLPGKQQIGSVCSAPLPRVNNRGVIVLTCLGWVSAGLSAPEVSNKNSWWQLKPRR